jgi:hypothetical protein
MRMIVLEGTAEEIQQSAQHLGLLGVFTAAIEPVSQLAQPNGGQGEGPTQEMLVRLLQKQPLKPNQKALLASLMKAQEDEWVSATDLAKFIGIAKGRKGLTGVMGGLGLRSGGIRGWPRRDDTGVKPTRWLWDHERRDREDFYRLRAAFRAAIKSLKIV